MLHFWPPKELRKALRTNLQSLAWQDDSRNRSVGVRRTGSYQPPAAEQPQAAERASDADRTAGLAASAYVAEHHAALEERKQGMVAEAHSKLVTLLDSFTLPVTRDQWAVWLHEHMDEFREQMRLAPARRREGNVRLRARPDLPTPARRIQPTHCCAGSHDAVWAQRLANRTGWYGVQTRGHGVIVVFLLVAGDRAISAISDIFYRNAFRRDERS